MKEEPNILLGSSQCRQAPDSTWVPRRTCRKGLLIWFDLRVAHDYVHTQEMLVLSHLGPWEMLEIKYFLPLGEAGTAYRVDAKKKCHTGKGEQGPARAATLLFSSSHSPIPAANECSWMNKGQYVNEQMSLMLFGDQSTAATTNNILLPEIIAHLRRHRGALYLSSSRMSSITFRNV